MEVERFGEKGAKRMNKNRIILYLMALMLLSIIAPAGADNNTDNLNQYVGHKITFVDVAYSANRLEAYEGIAFNGYLFMACNNRSIANARELYTWNGNPDAASIQQANGSIYSEPAGLVKCNGALYLVAKVNAGSFDLVKITGSAPTFTYTQIFDNAGNTLSLRGRLEPFIPPLVAMGNKLYMYCQDNNNAVILREYDTANSAWKNVISYAGKSALMLMGATDNKVFYSPRDASGHGNMYIYDGTSTFAVGESKMKDPQYFCVVNNVAYFGAVNSSDSVRRLWRSDGSEAGTVEIPIDNDLGYNGNFQQMASVRGQLYLPVSKNYYSSGGTVHYLYCGSVNVQGVITPYTFRQIKNFRDTVSEGARAHWLDVINNALYFQVCQDVNNVEVGLGYWQCDGTAPGTVKISNDSQKNFTSAGILGGKLLVTDIGSGTPFKLARVPNQMDNQSDMPTNLQWAGLRQSNYGIQSKSGNPDFEVDPNSTIPTIPYEFPEAWRWEAGSKAIASYFPGSNTDSCVLWIVTRPRVDKEESSPTSGGGCVIQMKRRSLLSGQSWDSKINFCDDAAVNLPASGTTIYYQYVNTDRHEAFLDYFDQAGIKVWLQIEPGWAPLEDPSTSTKGVLTAVIDYIAHQDQDPSKPLHPCVIGVGLDVEWYRHNREDCTAVKDSGSISPKNAKNAGEDPIGKLVQWYQKCKANGLMLYLKHYAYSDVENNVTYEFMPAYKDVVTRIKGTSGLDENDLQKIVFINDSQGFRLDWSFTIAGPTCTPKDAWNDMKSAFGEWVTATTFTDTAVTPNKTYASPVGFQVLYPNDWVTRIDGHPEDNNCGWMNFMDTDVVGEETWLDDPAPWNTIPEGERWKLIPKLGIKLAYRHRDRKIGLFVVDFRARLLFANTVFSWQESSYANNPNMIKNPGFTNSLSYWSFYVDPAANAEAYSEHKQFRAYIPEAGTETWHVHLRQDNLPLVRGHTYYLQFDAKSVESPRSILCLAEKNGGNYDTYGSNTYYLTQQMQTFSQLFTMRNPTDPVASICFEFGIEPIDVMIDNVKLVDVTSGGGSVPLWTVGVHYSLNDTVSYNGVSYKCIQAHTAQVDWAPPYVPALWSRL
jgi:hypothetical protein